jgi:hypothetical protein
MTRGVWFFVVPLLALLVFAARSTVFRSSRPAVVAPTATSDVVKRTGPVLAPDDQEHEEHDQDVAWRARTITSPVFK